MLARLTMHARRLLFAPLFTLLAAAPALGQDAPQLPDDADRVVTQTKVEALSREMRDLQKLQDLIARLGDPSRQLPGESSQEYLDRVDTVLKARGMLVALAGEQVKEVLTEVHLLEAQIEEYEEWAEFLVENVASMKETRVRRRDELVETLDDARYRLAAVAAVIKERDLTPEQTAEPDAGSFASRVTGFAVQQVDGRPIPDLAGKKAEFEPMQAPARQTAFDDLTAEVVDATYELSYLEDFAISETDAFGGDLPAAHRDVIKQAREQLRAANRVRDYGSQLSILARYTKENLALARKQDLQVTLRVRELAAQLPRTEEALSVAGGNVTFADRDGIASLMNRTAPSPDAAPPTGAAPDAPADRLARRLLAAEPSRPRRPDRSPMIRTASPLIAPALALIAWSAPGSTAAAQIGKPPTAGAGTVGSGGAPKLDPEVLSLANSELEGALGVLDAMTLDELAETLDGSREIDAEGRDYLRHEADLRAAIDQNERLVERYERQPGVRELEALLSQPAVKTAVTRLLKAENRAAAEVELETLLRSGGLQLNDRTLTRAFALLAQADKYRRAVNLDRQTLKDLELQRQKYVANNPVDRIRYEPLGGNQDPIRAAEDRRQRFATGNAPADEGGDASPPAGRRGAGLLDLLEQINAPAEPLTGPSAADRPLRR